MTTPRNRSRRRGYDEMEESNDFSPMMGSERSGGGGREISSEYDEGNYTTPPSATEAVVSGTRGGPGERGGETYGVPGSDVATPVAVGRHGQHRSREDFEGVHSVDGRADNHSFIDEGDDMSEMEGESSMDYNAQSSVEELF